MEKRFKKTTKKGLKSPHLNLKLTRVEEEVLDLITTEFLTVKKIALRRKCSLQSVYKIIKKLKEKGVYVGHKFNNLDKKKEIYINKNGYVIFPDSIMNEFCYFCDYHGEIIQMHHILPRKDNGKDNDKNLLPLCPNCHRLIHQDIYGLCYYNGYFYLRNLKKNFMEDIIYPSIRQKNIQRRITNKMNISILKTEELFNAFGELAN